MVFGVYFRLLRNTATAAMTMMMTTAAMATYNAVLLGASGSGTGEGETVGDGVAVGVGVRGRGWGCCCTGLSWIYAYGCFSCRRPVRV